MTTRRARPRLSRPVPHAREGRRRSPASRPGPTRSMVAGTELARAPANGSTKMPSGLDGDRPWSQKSRLPHRGESLPWTAAQPAVLVTAHQETYQGKEVGDSPPRNLPSSQTERCCKQGWDRTDAPQFGGDGCHRPDAG